MSPHQYKLTYFNKRGGGEIIRLVFAAAGADYVDDRVDQQEWENIKTGMPMKNLPVLTITSGGEETIYCQSAAIARYLSRKFGLYGDSDIETFLINEMYDSVGDVRSLLVQLYFCKDDTVKSEIKRKLTSVIIPNFSSYFDTRATQYGSNGFILGSKMTLADLVVFNLIDGCLEIGFGSLWNSYPRLLHHQQNILKNDNIARWIQDRPKTPL